MILQLKQVALTYATRRSLWLLLLFGAICVGPSAAISLVPDQPGTRFSPFVSMAVGFAAGLIGWVLMTQAKWQFCDQRARLLPRFATPHLVILAAIALVGLGLYPYALAVAGPFNPLGLTACTIGLGSSYIWAMHSSNRFFTAVALLHFFSLMFPQGLAFWSSDSLAPLHAAILVAGWTAFAAWLWRLSAIREDDPDFAIPIHAQQGAATRMERVHSGRAIDQLMSRSAWQRLPSEWWHDRLTGMRASTVRQRKRLLSYGFSPTPAWIHAIPMAAMFFAIFYVLAKVGFIAPGGPTQSILPTFNMVLIMPTMIIGTMLSGRRARMAQEIVFPLDRRQFIDGLLVAIGQNAFIIWLTMHSAVLALLIFKSPDMLTPSFIVGLSAISLAVQIYAFGAQVLCAQSASGGNRLVATVIGIGTAVVPLMIGIQFLGTPGQTLEQAVAEALQKETPSRAHVPAEVRQQLDEHTRKNAITRWERVQPWSPPWLWSTVAVTTVVGACVTAHGRKRWLELELG